MYDEKCETLARDFLDDEFSQLDRDDFTEKIRRVELHTPKLAQAIQDAIESYLADIMPATEQDDHKGSK